MPILNVQPSQVGQSGVFPAIIYILTNDTLAEVSATGYLNGIVSKFGIPLSESDIALVTTKTSPNSNSTQVGWFAVTKSGENWSLTAPTSEGGVILPTTANHIATYTNTLGELSEDATTAINNGNIQATQSLIGGTGVTATTGDINAVTGNLNSLTGNVNAGSSGHSGSLISFPATATNGLLAISAVNAGGGFNTIISNGVMGQSTVYTLGDIGSTTGGVVVATSAIRMKSVASALSAGGAAAQSFTDAFCTIGSNVVGNWSSQANAASVLKIVAANGSFVVTSSADAGVGTFNYIITK